MSTYPRLVIPRLRILFGYGTSAQTELETYWDVSAQYLTGAKLSFGRDQARAFSPGKIETLDFVLDNSHGMYSNGGGPLLGFVTRGTPVQLYLTWDPGAYADSPEYGADDPFLPVEGSYDKLVFTGSIDEVVENISMQPTVAISALGMLRLFNRDHVTIPLYEGIRPDEAIALICNEVDFPVENRILDEADAILQYFWAAHELPLELLHQLTASDGVNAAYYVQDGYLHYEGSQFRANNPNSLTPQYYLYDKLQTSAPVFEPIHYSPPTTKNSGEIYNKVVAKTNYRLFQYLGQIWSYGADISLPTDAVTVIYPTNAEPFMNAITPEEGVDYSVVGVVTSIVLEQTSGTRIKMTITAGSGGCVISGPPGQLDDGIYIRANLIKRISVIDVESTTDTADSIERYEPQVFDIPLWPEMNPVDVQDIVNGIARRYQQPRDQFTVRVHNLDHAHAIMILLSSISDKVHLTNTRAVVDNDYYIETKAYEILGNGNIVAVLGMERALDEDAFRFGIDLFGTGVFGE